MTPRVAAALEIGFNRYLGREPAALDDCRRLAGRRIAFRAVDHAIEFVVEFQPVGVRIDEDATSADARVVAPLLALLNGGLGVIGRNGSEHWSAMTVDGDAVLVAEFSTLLGKVGLDVEELLGPLVGGAAAHRLIGFGHRLGKAAKGWIAAAGRRSAGGGGTVIGRLSAPDTQAAAETENDSGGEHAQAGA